MKKADKIAIIIVSIVLFFIFFILFVINETESDDIEYDFCIEEKDYSAYFQKDCPVSINGNVELVDYSTPFLRLKLCIGNVTQNSISAIKLLFVCKDVYGDEIKLYTADYDKNPIEKDCFISLDYKVDQKIRFIDVKVYDVYFKENKENEWGKRELKTSDIKKYAPTICSLSL